MALFLRHLSHPFHELERGAKTLEAILLLQVMFVHEPPIISELATEGPKLLAMEGRHPSATGHTMLGGQTFFAHGWLLGPRDYIPWNPG
jgi:hypothetical protein